MPDTYQIAVRSYEVMNAPLLGQAVHNEIVFLKNGEVICALNGDPWSRKTGEINFPSLSGEDTLRARLTDKSMKSFATEFPMVAEATLLETNDPEIMKRHLGRAVDAADFINNQNMDYVIIGGPFHIAQNSNSVSHTLATAMGLNYPPEIENLWAPGHGRVLLTNQWQAASEGMQGDVLTEYLQKKIGKLEETEISQQVKRDPNPYANYVPNDGSTDRPGVLFDPQKAEKNKLMTQVSYVPSLSITAPEI